MASKGERANGFFEDEASAAHELFAELLTAPVGDVLSGDHEPFS